MRFHALGLQHTITSKEYIACAFTQKVLKFCSMMTLRGHTVIHYGHEDSDVECTEHVTVLSREAYNRVYGEHDFRSKLFKFDQSDDAYNTFNANAIREINARKQPGDFLLAFWGSGHQSICNGAGEGMRVVEPGIGYPHGHFADYKIFESYAIYHAFMKTDRVAHCVGVDTWSKEAVIPNYFDVSDFVDTVVPAKDRGDYFLFVGRIGSAKGVDHAIRMTDRLGIRLLVAGQNAEDGLKEVGMYPPPKHVEIIGHVDVEKRKTLMANAKAVVCMSTFAEPFCGVHVEAMMSGTPIITADWGAFTEFNLHGITGFRCRTLDQMVEAGRRIHEIDPMVCRKWAFDNFSTDRVADMYEAFFEGNMTPLLVSTKKKVAVWCETKWALGRIGTAIKKYIPNVDMYDWGNPSHNTAFWNDGKWKEYDSIISNTTLHSLDKLYGFHPTDEMLRRFVVIAHFPRFEGMSYFQETLEKHRKESQYAGVSRETCEEMKKYGVESPAYVPFGADTDVFPLTHKVTGPIRRIGIIGGTTRTKEWAAHDEYVKNKGLLMFSDICQRGGYEPVYIHGKTKDLYSDIDALICCSEIEGGPLGIFEAASCGIPVLTRPVGNVQFIKGIQMFDTADDALNVLDKWNNDVDNLRNYTKAVTSEVRINWSMRTLLKRHLMPVLTREATYETLKPEIDVHVSCLKQIVEASGEPCEGNVFWFQYDHQERELFLNKRLNLFNYSQKAQNIMEIGFNAGHSCLLYLLSNPTSKIQLFDLGEHKYTRACFEYLSIQFPNRLTITYGDSRQTVPAYIAENVGKVFDMIHVDGGHDQSVVRSDILNTLNLSDTRTVIISDDDNIPHIARVNRQYFEALPDALPSAYHYVGKIR
jgi:glycosyltransferase involved in cell wall biosynthesis